jgi:FtsH-binding integral membrane protein
MTYNFNSTLFGVCAIVFFVLLIISRYGPIKTTIMGGMSVIGALMLPAFMPRGGDVVLVIPSASLFSSHDELSWAIACISIVINYLILTKLFNFTRG